MTYQEVSALVEGFGLPCAYYQFTEDTAVPPPFVCWYFTDSDDFAADDTNYQRIRPLVIELYTRFKGFALEAQIEEALNAAELVYSRYEEQLDDEKMIMITFQTEVVING